MSSARSIEPTTGHWNQQQSNSGGFVLYHKGILATGKKWPSGSLMCSPDRKPLAMVWTGAGGGRGVGRKRKCLLPLWTDIGNSKREMKVPRQGSINTQLESELKSLFSRYSLEEIRRESWFLPQAQLNTGIVTTGLCQTPTQHQPHRHFTSHYLPSCHQIRLLLSSLNSLYTVLSPHLCSLHPLLSLCHTLLYPSGPAQVALASDHL